MIDPASGATAWNKLVIGGQVSPGVVRLSGPGIQIGWDVQNATAMAGAITKRTQEPLKEFSAEFDLSDEQDDLGVSDFDLWDAFQQFLESLVTTGKKPRAADVYHPDLARCRITSATVKSIGMLVLDGKGGGRITVAFMEHRPPKPLKPVPSTKTEGDKKIDEATAEITKLQQEWKTL